MIKLKQILLEETSYGKKTKLQEDDSVIAELIVGFTIILLPGIISVVKQLAHKTSTALGTLAMKAVGTFSPKAKAEMDKARKAMEKEKGDEESAMARMAVQDHMDELSKDQELMALVKVLIDNPYIHYMDARTDKQKHSQHLRRTANNKISDLIKRKYPELAAKLEQFGRASLSKYSDILTGTPDSIKGNK